MTVDYDEKVEISKLPPVKRYQGCALLQAAKDKKLKAALFFELGDSELVDRVMRVIKGERG